MDGIGLSTLADSRFQLDIDGLTDLGERLSKEINRLLKTGLGSARQVARGHERRFIHVLQLREINSLELPNGLHDFEVRKNLRPFGRNLAPRRNGQNLRMQSELHWLIV